MVKHENRENPSKNAVVIVVVILSRGKMSTYVNNYQMVINIKKKEKFDEEYIGGEQSGLPVRRQVTINGSRQKREDCGIMQSTLDKG